LEAYREKIEQHAVTMEKMGLSPAASRVFVYLLFSKQGTFDDMVDYFKMSKSAISNALKYLMTIGMVDFKTIGGKRKRYFYIDVYKWVSEKYISERFKLFSDMVDDVNMAKRKDGDFRKDLDDVSAFYKLLLVEMPIIIERLRNMINLEKKEYI
jgi:DNA-binding transcriptional regulator GbsR (MarR family)